MSIDDDLARTATAPADGSCTPTARDAGDVPGTPRMLDRYVIERQLGAGGMGVVYEAFDPDLERRIAIKFLRDGIAAEAEQRLLREARAMARLAHPNVVSVYEVGSANGRDFIAMELIDGEPLVDWLRSQQRPQRDILAAFLAAGRGLAAAHEAGVVHRDFKPHNILRSKSGRIVVTDFGLARESATPVVAEPASRNTPTSLSGLTQTGAMLGTPAYMAPEQWAGAAVTPATDQFAFCVALWEALAGERPFRGNTAEMLRAEIDRGPAMLDASKIPRRLRAPLRRGLARDPGARWPSMHALLAAIEPPRRTVVIVATLGVAAIAAGAVPLVLANREAGAPACEAPMLDPRTVWTAEHDLQVRAASPVAAKMFRDAIASWEAQRAAACKLPDAQRRHRLACLDRVLVRIDALRRARLLDLTAPPGGMVRQAYDAAACTLDPPPKMPDRYSDAAVVGLAVRAGASKIAPEVIAEARRATDTDACAATYFGIFDVGTTNSLHVADNVRRAAERCGDAQAYGAATLNLVARKVALLGATDLPDLLREAEQSVAAAGQPMLRTQWHTFRGQLAMQANRFDEALEAYTTAYDGPADIEDKLRYTYERFQALLARGRPADLEQIRREVPGWKAVSIVHAGGVYTMLDWYDALAQWRLGEEEAGGRRLRQLALQVPFAGTGKAMRGVVVDASGKPVPEAIVVAGTVMGDSFRGVLPANEVEVRSRSWEFTKTDRDGRFVFDPAPNDGVMIAELDDRRSAPQPLGTATLRLAPTAAVSGRVQITGERRGDLWVSIKTSELPYDHVATVRPDGTFHAAKLPPGRVTITVGRNEGTMRASGAGQEITIPSTNVELAAPGGRKLTVLVRSTSSVPTHRATVYVLARNMTARTVAEVERALATTAHVVDEAQAVTSAAPARHAPGDLLATVLAPPTGTLCILGIQVDERDREFWQKLAAQHSSLEVKCVPLTADETIVVEVPPMRRL